MSDLNLQGIDAATMQFAAASNRPDRTMEQLAASVTDENGNFDIAAARRTAEEFEGTFLATLVDTMFSGVETNGPFGGGQSEEMFRSMMNQEYAKSMAGQGGLGLADNVLRAMLQMQGLDPALANEGTR